MLGRKTNILLKAPITSLSNFVENVNARIAQALKARSISSTVFNSMSSRMHATVELNIDGGINNIDYAANYIIVDMAGTESNTNMQDTNTINSSILHVTEALKKISADKNTATISSNDTLVQHLKKYLNCETDIAIVYMMCDTTPVGTALNGAT